MREEMTKIFTFRILPHGKRRTRENYVIERADRAPLRRDD